MSGQDTEILRLDTKAMNVPLRVGLLHGEPAGMIPTRTAGAVAIEATLEWPPGEGGVSVGGLLPTIDRDTIVGSLRESAGVGVSNITGTLRSFDDDDLCSVVDDALRAMASAATVHEAVLRTRALRISRVSCPTAGLVQTLSRHLWDAGLRARFGASWSPAIPGADVMLGCLNARKEIVEALTGYSEAEHVLQIARAGATG